MPQSPSSRWRRVAAAGARRRNAAAVADVRQRSPFAAGALPDPGPRLQRRTRSTRENANEGASAVAEVSRPLSRRRVASREAASAEARW
jgi:hypothetical protein